MIATEYAAERERMVREQLEKRGIRDPRVLEAFRAVPRHQFVPPGLVDSAYEDRPLQIGRGQTISQPLMVGLMTQALELRGGEKVLEVGTGSGYQAAILLQLGARVFSVERHAELQADAGARLERAGCGGASLRVGDGTLGWPEEAPFDRIIVTAGAPDVPIELLKQLGEGGSMLIPIGDEQRQVLTRFRRAEGRIVREDLGACAFVKLIGREGWPA